MNMKEATKKMKQDSPKLAGLSEAQRNLALEKVKEALLLNKEVIFLENKKMVDHFLDSPPTGPLVGFFVLRVKLSSIPRFS